MIYRVQQFFSALAARRNPPDIDPARDLLPPQLLALFAQMPAEDQRHGLTVLADLRERGESAEPLLQAALLHDVGKSGAGVGLPHRVARVLFKKPLPPFWRWLSGCPTGWRRPYWVVANHPSRGATWVGTEGGSKDLVGLIRFHESRPPEAWQESEKVAWHAALAWADARS